jgi:hypothetical protein
MAQGGYAGIQFSYSGGNHAFFNANTGDVWEYGDHGNFRNVKQVVNELQLKNQKATSSK